MTTTHRHRARVTPGLLLFMLTAVWTHAPRVAADPAEPAEPAAPAPPRTDADVALIDGLFALSPRAPDWTDLPHKRDRTGAYEPPADAPDDVLLAYWLDEQRLMDSELRPPPPPAEVGRR